MMTGGLGLTYVKIAQNGGKLPRHNTDRWDRVRLTITGIDPC